MSMGRDQFYRFSQPLQPDYPAMIELFCRKPYTFELKFDTGLTPIFIGDDIASLSAILLNDAYYDSLLKSQIIVRDCSVIEIKTLILFKIKARLDLKGKFGRGEKLIQKISTNIRMMFSDFLPLSFPGIQQKFRMKSKLIFGNSC